MERKPQQQTLSIRISEALRDYLERAKQVISNGRGEGVSTSDVAKMLLESAKDDRLDYRLEMADLQRDATDAMANIRTKWKRQQGVSRAEWIFLAQYIQIGCEETSEDPDLPSRESYAALLEATLAVRSLRADRGVELDRYYLGNLAPREETALNERRLDSDVVPRIVGSLIQELRTAPSTPKPTFSGRNFYVALRDETLPNIVALNETLMLYMPTLFRLGARGHWIREHRPVRAQREELDFVSPIIPRVEAGSFFLSIHVNAQRDLSVLIGMDAKDVMYPLSPYPQIREFSAMLAHLGPGRPWEGKEFAGHTDQERPDKPMRLYFRRPKDGVMVILSAEDWRCLKELYARALALPELQPVLEELSLVYGEV
jgi:hypothetical protein